MEFKEYYKKKDVVDSYDKLISKGLKALVVRRLDLAAIDSLLKKGSILEIGVGTGFIARMLMKKGDFYGIDISSEMLRKVQEFIPKARLSEGNILDLKLARRFDNVVSIRVVSHFNEKDASLALMNVKKILNEQGVFIFNLEKKFALRRLLRKLTKWGSTYTYQYNKEEIEEMMGKVGLKIDKMIYTDHFFLIPLHFLNKLCFNKLEKFITAIELKILNVGFMANNVFIKCRK